MQPTAFQRRIAFWIAALIFFLAFLFIFSPILLPFVLGLILAYALDPVADWFQKLGFSRLIAAVFILTILLFTFMLLAVALLPILINQLAGLINVIPSYFEQLQRLLLPLLDSEAAVFLGIDADTIRASLSTIMREGAVFMTRFLTSIWSSGRAILDWFILLVVTPFIAFYLLYDWDRMLSLIDSWLPRSQAPVIRQLVGEMSTAINGFVRGQSLLCLFLGVFYAIGLSFVQLPYGLLIGLGAGLFSFIPFAGSILGFIVAMSVACVTFWPQWMPIVATGVIFIGGQFIEGNILQPRLLGESVGLHPVWLMFSLVAFGYLFGFVGLLIAVPAAAAIGVLVRFALRRYLSSEFYRGHPPQIPPPETKDV
ncbi:MAG: AI-2E family transporter [Bauldia sp.]|nr:AI-2E family transporter [Bauldia sp.]